MRRSGFSEEAIENIALAYRQIYSSGTSLENAVLRIKDVCTPSPEIDYILRFIEESKMGIYLPPTEKKVCNLFIKYSMAAPADLSTGRLHLLGIKAIGRQLLNLTFQHLSNKRGRTILVLPLLYNT